MHLQKAIIQVPVVKMQFPKAITHVSGSANAGTTRDIFWPELISERLETLLTKIKAKGTKLG